MAKDKESKFVQLDPFQEWCHKWGRVGTLLALIYMVALPFIVLGVYGCIPSLGEVINLGTIGILVTYIPVGISEALSYTPILGASSYLTFITGNIMNLKVPAAVNAMQITGKESNTPEGEAISSLAVSVCSIMTIIILTLAAALSGLISPIFELPAVKTASDYLVPSLFGCLFLGLFSNSQSGKKVVKNGVMGVVPVLIIVSVIALVFRIVFHASAYSMVGYLILIMLPVAIISSRIMWKKGIITVEDNDQAPKKEE